ncbi:MAG: Bax inhibitor-1/YccA family protein [Prevotellaceae bacterium]|jgi:uncharacterized YccA/Bax inhibitor family protein|nr:Bax inhibitor-1/YccA family protein [Prevotellaceae bacterium]
MALFKTSSPALNDRAFANACSASLATDSVMTVRGAIHKTFLLILLALLGASYAWQVFAGAPVSEDGAVAAAAVMPYMWGGLIGGLIFSLIAIFSPRRSRWAAPLYAICEGLCLGAISSLYNFSSQGIVIQAVGLTFAVLLLMLLLYRSGVIKVTQKLRSGIIIATGAIALFYLVTWIVSIFTSVSFMHDATPLSIGISLLVVGVAAFNFLLDFDFIDRGAQMGAPKYMEWYGAFGLMLTLVWLYLEMLRLLSKLNRR